MSLFDADPEASPRSKLKLVVAYDGTDFHGFAAQPDVRTVAGVLSKAMDPLAAASIVNWQLAACVIASRRSLNRIVAERGMGSGFAATVYWNAPEPARAAPSAIDNHVAVDSALHPHDEVVVTSYW